MSTEEEYLVGGLHLEDNTPNMPFFLLCFTNSLMGVSRYRQLVNAIKINHRRKIEGTHEDKDENTRKKRSIQY